MAHRVISGSADPAFPVEFAIARICGQHRDIARVLGVLDDQVGAIRGQGTTPDFDLMEEVLRYIDLYGICLHRSCEEKLLFQAMSAHGAPQDIVGGALDRHRRSVGTLAALLRAFQAWRRDACEDTKPERAGGEFLGPVPVYLAGEREVIAFEEKVVLPCAVELLPATDWAGIAQAFGDHEDPLFCEHPAPALKKLWKHFRPAEAGTGGAAR
jgi:hemerythrin-like domain-containing protein